MSELAEYVDGLPNISGSEQLIESAIHASAGKSIYLAEGGVDFGKIRAAAAIALHMHQPLIPAGGGDLHTAGIISNLKHMADYPNIGDNHNWSVFKWCYKRMGEFLKCPKEGCDYSTAGAKG